MLVMKGRTRLGSSVQGPLEHVRRSPELPAHRRPRGRGNSATVLRAQETVRARGGQGAFGQPKYSESCPHRSPMR